MASNPHFFFFFLYKNSEKNYYIINVINNIINANYKFLLKAMEY